jgi:hypothetical protein
VDIRFTSSLTPEDENAIAPAILKAVASFLDLLPIAYMIRIDTADSKVFQHVGGNAAPEEQHSPTSPMRGRMSNGADDSRVPVEAAARHIRLAGS